MSKSKVIMVTVLTLTLATVYTQTERLKVDSVSPDISSGADKAADVDVEVGVEEIAVVVPEVTPEKVEPQLETPKPQTEPAKPEPVKPTTPTPVAPKPTEPTKKPEQAKPAPKPVEPVHTHVWTPQYKDHLAQAAQGYDVVTPAVTQDVPGYYFNSDLNNFVSREVIVNEYKGDPGTYSRQHSQGKWNWAAGTKTTVITPASSKWVETSPAKPAWQELTHYVCLVDGVTKQP